MKANPKPWLYGPNWQGIRCEARTRRGTLCQRPARLPVGRCKLHGGASTGPRTKDGLARLTEAKTKHGRFTKEKRAAARRFAETGAADARRTEGAGGLVRGPRSSVQGLAQPIQVSPAPSVVGVTVAKRDSSHLRYRRRYPF